MPQVTYKCEFAQCDWEAKTDTVGDYVALYQIHVKAKHPDTVTATSSSPSPREPPATCAPAATAAVSDV